MSAIARAVRFIAREESFREWAYPDPGSELAKRTRGLVWGFRPAADVIAGLPVDIRDLPGDPWTVGYGATGPDIGPHTRWAKDHAERWLTERVTRDADRVNALVKVQLAEHQLTAVLSFVYNVGLGAFSDSTLLRMINRGNFAGAADQFLRWVYSGGERMRGLETRRQREREIFLGR